MVALTGLETLYLPVSNIDDRLYYASRAAYWMQHRSALHFDTHNQRELIFPITDRLPFFWPMLFTRTETPGLVVMWLAYPLAAIGMFSVLRQMGQSQVVSALGTTVLALTPQILSQTTGAHSELWVTLFGLGCVFWLARAWRNDRPMSPDFVWLGIFAALAAASRLTALPLLASVLLVVLLITSARRWHAMVACAGGILIGFILSGWLLTLVENVRYFGHPLGPTAIRQFHAPTYSSYQTSVHAARALATLLEPPIVPSDELAQQIAADYARVLSALGLNRPLPMEQESSPWPGPYRIEAHRFGQYYSLPGMLWPIALLSAMALAIIDVKRTWPDIRLRPAALLAVLVVPFLLAVVFGLRWMGVMGRFWVAPYAMSLVIIVAFAAQLTRRFKWLRIVCVIAIVATIAPAAVARTIAFARALRDEPNPVALDEPYAEPLYHIEPGSTILLIAGQGTRDYPLFRPRAGFIDRVISWGRHEFDADRLHRVIERERVDYIILENDRALDFAWDPSIPTLEFARAMSVDPALAETPLQYTPGMRLFGVRGRR
jgi:hypothetical protein